MKKVKLPRKSKKKFIKLYGRTEYILDVILMELDNGNRFFKWRYIETLVNANGGYNSIEGRRAKDIYLGKISKKEGKRSLVKRILQNLAYTEKLPDEEYKEDMKKLFSEDSYKEVIIKYLGKY